MTLEEMLLENRTLFLVGEINHISASRLIMQMLYLQSVKRTRTSISTSIRPAVSWMTRWRSTTR
jgi:ATP-dependent protease ClpP protease subunit